MDVNEIEEALKDESSTGEESSTEPDVKAEAETQDSEETEEVTEPESEKKSSRSAQGRIQELVSGKKDLEGQLESMQQLISDRDATIKGLTDAVSARDQEHLTLEKINEMYNDPEFEGMKPYLEFMDKYVRGKADASEFPGGSPKGETEDKSEDVALDKAAADIEKTIKSIADMDEKIEDHKANLLLHQADESIEKYFEALPEEDYNDEDRTLLAEMVDKRIDWDGIEGDPDSLPDLVATGFEEALKSYGTPKGKLSAGTQKEETTEKTTPEPLTHERVANLELGKLRTVETPDGKKVEPVVSDLQMKDLMAQVIRESAKSSS